MIITKTPFRISFFGGGTDYPSWFRQHGGQVVSTAIDKFSYISCRYLPPFFSHTHRISYSKLEHVNGIDEINHPSVKACLHFMNISGGMEIHHDSDLPARSGLGSSSAFTVGLLQGLYALRGQMVDKLTLARNAIVVESEKIGEHVGWQDQTVAAFGGFNVITFGANDTIDVKPLILPPERQEALNQQLFLIYTGKTRIASTIAKTIIANTEKNARSLYRMTQMVQEAVNILAFNNDLKDFGKLLDEHWQFKKTLATEVSSSDIDDLYSTIRSAGAVGGKILGAGGGGFFLAFVPFENQEAFRMKLGNLLVVPFKFEPSGCEIIYYRP